MKNDNLRKVMGKVPIYRKPKTINLKKFKDKVILREVVIKKNIIKEF